MNGVMVAHQPVELEVRVQIPFRDLRGDNMSNTIRVLPETSIKSLVRKGKKIIWLENPAKFEFVRQKQRVTDTPKRFPLKRWDDKGYLVIGYEITPRNKAQGRGEFVREVFFRKEYDNIYRGENYPAEAVHFSTD